MEKHCVLFQTRILERLRKAVVSFQQRLEKQVCGFLNAYFRNACVKNCVLFHKHISY
jgi:hypothetical protein